MHTFLINTSSQKLNDYGNIFEIQQETRELVSFDFPLEKWCEKAENKSKNFLSSTGDERFGGNVNFENYALEMGEMIDSYKELKNSFNLIIYVDLLDFKQYAGLTGNLERMGCLTAMHTVLRHFIRETLWKALRDLGREPVQTLVIFETKDSPDLNYNSENVQENIFDFIGIDFEKLRAVTEKEAQSTKKCEESMKYIENYAKEPLVEGLAACYSDVVGSWEEDVRRDSYVTSATMELWQNILEKDKREREEIKTVAFVTDRIAKNNNRLVQAKRNFALCVYFAECVRKQSIYEDDNNEKVREFPEIDWDKAAKFLENKKQAFKREYRKSVSYADNFMDGRLAPVVYKIDNEKYGVDEFGEFVGEPDKLIDNYVSFAESSHGKEPAEARGKKAEPAEPRKADLKKTVKRTAEKIEENITNEKSDRTKAESVLDDGAEIFELHAKYAQKLKKHVSRVVSRYAGASDANSAALLPKRAVHAGDIGDIGEQGEGTQRRYLGGKDEKDISVWKEENDIIKDFADNSYESAVLAYLGFCAGRSVCVTDVEEQYDWFKSRIKQISESLAKIKKVAIGLLMMIFVIYLPYIAVQWKDITADTGAIFVALCSFIIPIAALYIIFGIVSSKQRKLYDEALDEFRRRSEAAIAENDLTADSYDKMLSAYIPALRCLYEYKLDTYFYIDCCNLAKAKLKHHERKLEQRIETIENILQDLEMDDVYRYEERAGDRKNSASLLDLNSAFCSCAKNREFYSIIGTDIFEYISVNKNN